MSTVVSILDRFRRGAGVPAVAADDTASELVPVFEALDELDAQAQAVREEAILQAERELAEANERRSEILALWRARASSEGERVEADFRRDSARELELLLADAQEQARVIRERGAERLPVLIEEVLTCVRAVVR